MIIRTDINPRFLMRMGLLGLVCLGLAAYCVYDGKVAYPAQRERALAYQEFEKQNEKLGSSKLGRKDLYTQWKIEAEKHGWDPGIAGKEETPYGPPKKPVEINGQFIMAAVIGLIGLIFLTRYLLNRGCWIKADGEGMLTSEKRELKYDQVTELNKKQWKSKGIARVMYEVDGRKNKIVLDDCNYVRDTTNAILRQLEAAIGHERITNGKPEPPLEPSEETAATTD